MQCTVSLNEKKHLCITGGVELNNVVEVCDKGLALIASMDTVIVDLAGISQADSSCLAMFVEWIRCAREQKKSIELNNAPNLILDLGRVCGLDTILPINKALTWQ